MKTMEIENETIPKFADHSINDKTRELLEARDHEFLNALFHEVNPYLGRVCMANGIYKENADEVIHETWESFFSNIGKFEGRSQIKTYICGILFNKIREYRRARGKTLYEDDSEKVMGHAFTPQGWWNNSPHNPQKLMELKQAGLLIKECLEGLTEQQKAAFVLREVDDENSESICNLLGVNVSYLRVLLFRAKDKLRSCLEGKAASDGRLSSEP